jgi:dCMP deaminase
MTTDEYYMGIAIAVREKANCLGRKVGAVLVKGNRIISAGYNGTPEGVDNCLDGGCVRCARKEQFAPSMGYDVCICVHAEENALITAARFGISVEGATAYFDDAAVLYLHARSFSGESPRNILSARLETSRGGLE